MSRRRIALSLVLTVFCAAEARPQSVEIDHKAVGCIVVGKYPKLNACFTPAANLARARVYFRPEGTPSWYYVDMKSDQPCFAGVLPRPGKKLVGKKVEYYVEGQDKTFNAGRTAEFAPIVVSNAGMGSGTGALTTSAGGALLRRRSATGRFGRALGSKGRAHHVFCFSHAARTVSKRAACRRWSLARFSAIRRSYSWRFSWAKPAGGSISERT